MSSTTIRRVSQGVAAGGAVLAGVQLYPAPPALAHDAGECSSGEICLYENDSFNEGAVNHVRHDWSGNINNYDPGDGYKWWDNTAQAWTTDELNDELSSVKNKGTRCSVTLFPSSDAIGGHSYKTTVLRGGDGDRNLGDNNIDHDNASSHRWCYYENGGDGGDFTS